MQPQRRHSVSGHVRLHVGKRGKTWYAKYRYPERQEDGRTISRQKEEKIGPAWADKGRPVEGSFTEKTAQAWLDAKLTDLRRGAVAGMHRTGATVADAAAEWLRHAEHERGVRHSTMREYRSAVNKHIVPEFGNLKLEDVSTMMIEQWRAGLIAEGRLSRRTIDKLVTILHGVYVRARRAYNFTDPNPVSDLEHLRHGYSGKFDFYTPEEVAALVRAAASEQDGAIYLTAAFTGLRRGELVALRWRDIDFTGEAIRVRASVTHGAEAAPKSGKVRTVPMVPEVASALAKLSSREHFTGDDDLVFPGDTGAHLDASALRRRYTRTQKQAGLRPLRFHDLRHTFGSLAINRASIVQVQEWLGHADIDTTRRYLHVKHRGDEARLLADAFRIEDVTADVVPHGHPGTQR